MHSEFHHEKKGEEMTDTHERSDNLHLHLLDKPVDSNNLATISHERGKQQETIVLAAISIKNNNFSPLLSSYGLRTERRTERRTDGIDVFVHMKTSLRSNVK